MTRIIQTGAAVQQPGRKLVVDNQATPDAGNILRIQPSTIISERGQSQANGRI
jgi:hypothetical protein